MHIDTAVDFSIYRVKYLPIFSPFKIAASKMNFQMATRVEIMTITHR